MTVVVETGAGIVGANAYAAVATITAYWDARQNRAEYAAWAAAPDIVRAGAAIEGAAFLDAEFGPYYRGTRAGYVQGLLHPRTGAKDDAGYPLPSLPPELVAANCELAGRAVTATLSADADINSPIKRTMLKVGSFTEDTEYAGTATAEKKFGIVAGILAPILNGAQPGAPGGSWAWT